MNSELNVDQIHSVIDTDEDLLEINQHIEAYKIIMEECRDRIENHKTRMEHNKTRMEHHKDRMEKWQEQLTLLESGMNELTINASPVQIYKEDLDIGQLTIAPISKNTNNYGHIDYTREQERVSNDPTPDAYWRWEDSKYNKATVGEYFAFYHHNSNLVIHKIVNIVPHEDRGIDWSTRPCNLLVLSKPLCIIPWTEWIELNGPQSRIATYTTANLKEGYRLVHDRLLLLE